MTINLGDNLVRNDVFKHFSVINDSNSEEIKKICESILEIRKISIEAKAKLQKLEKESDNNILPTKINNLFTEVDKLRALIEENFNGLDAVDDENMGNIVRNLSLNMKLMNDKVNK